MGMSMGIGFQYPMDMGRGMGVIFENGYRCGYRSAHPIAIPSAYAMYIMSNETKTSLGKEVEGVFLLGIPMEKRVWYGN